jgi:serine/threonine protein kinase
MTQPHSDPRTALSPPRGMESGRDPHIGSSSVFGHTLPEGTRLNEFEILGLIGEGGFGIVYLAYDPTLERRVAVKEYMPSALASRTNGSMTVAPRSERHAGTFRAGLKSFVNEARLLARFDHPALVKVYRFWEANGTAYMVMPYYEGPTLQHVLNNLPQPLTEAELRGWLAPLLDALGVMHAAQCYHRDIAPDNILLTETGPLLLDFGAARRVVGDMTQALTVVLKPGYAPIEQYGDAPTMVQGPWTDLYALACVVYRAVSGRTPKPSVERLMGDLLLPLRTYADGRYSDVFIDAIEAALAVQPSERPQSVAEFLALLAGERPIDLPITVAPRPIVPDDLPLPEPFDPTTWASDSGMLPTEPGAPWPSDGAEPLSASGFASASAPVRPRWLPIDTGPATPPVSRGRSRMWVAVGVLAACALATAVSIWQRPVRGTDGLAAPAVPASAVPPPTPTPTVATPAPVALPQPPAPAAASSPSPAAIEAAAPTPVPRTPPRAQPATRVRPDASERPAPTRGTPPARCSDLLQKASLEALNAEESRFLKTACR